MSIVDLINTPARWPELFRRLPAVQDAIAQEHAAEVSERQRLVDEIAAAEAALLDALPSLDKSLADARKKFERAQQQLHDAQAAYDAAESARAVRTRACDMLKDRNSRALFDSRPERVANFIAELDALLQRTRNETPQTAEDIEHSVLRGRERVKKSNYNAFRARLAAIQDARAEADKLHLIADPAAIEARIVELRQGIPERSADEWEVIERASLFEIVSDARPATLSQ
jgi:hypothetical protein